MDEPVGAGTPGQLSRRHRLRGPLLTAGLVGGVTLALHFRDPHSAGSWGICPWLALTGQYCPGCGSLRAVNDLTHGDVVAAAGSNLIFVLMVPVLVFWWLRWTERAWSGTAPAAVVGRRSGLWIALATVVMVAFGVFRNLPAGSWLAP
jgi:hypothetical protein